MTERDKILDDLETGRRKSGGAGRELDAAREQYKTCEDVIERVRLAGLIDELPHMLADLNRNWAVVDRDAQRVRKQLHKLDKEADNLCVLVADAPATLATWDEQISQTRRKMEGIIGMMEADKLRSLATVQNAQERLQALVGGV